MALDSISLEDALRLLQLPRSLGTDPATGEEIVAMNGRYGPYLKRGDETRSLDTEDQLFEVTLEEAAGTLRPAEATPLRRVGVTVARARHRRRQRRDDPVALGPLRPLRHRRDGERLAPPWRRPRDDHAQSGHPSCWRHGGRPARRSALGQAKQARRRAGRRKRPPRRPAARRRRAPRRRPGATKKAGAQEGRRHEGGGIRYEESARLSSLGDQMPRRAPPARAGTGRTGASLDRLRGRRGRRQVDPGALCSPRRSAPS